MPPAAASADRGARTATPPPAPSLLWVRGAHNTLSIPLASAPVGVTLDPGTWVTMVESTFVAH
jgi:hypothetical protein